MELGSLDHDQHGGMEPGVGFNRDIASWIAKNPRAIDGVVTGFVNMAMNP